MEFQENGTSKKNSRRRDQRVRENQQGGLGKTGDSGTICGIKEQSGFTTDDSEWRDTGGTNSYDGHTPIGKILQRLKLIETEHLDYVRGHQERLEARLDDSKKREESFKQKIAELEQEIYKLVASSNDEKLPSD